MNELTRHDVSSLLQEETKASSQRAWARAHGVSAPYVGDVIKGHRTPGPRILAALGLRAIEHDTRYERIPVDNVEASTSVS